MLHSAYTLFLSLDFCIYGYTMLRLKTLLTLGSVCVALMFAPAWALTPQEALDMSTGESDNRIVAINQAAAHADARTIEFLQALSEDRVKTASGQVWVMLNEQAQDPVTGSAATLPVDAEDVLMNNRLRASVESALSGMKLTHPDASMRMASALALLKEPNPDLAQALDTALAQETDATIRSLMNQARAAINLQASETPTRLLAAQTLAQSTHPEVMPLLNQQLQNETDPDVQKALQKALQSVQSGLAWGERIASVFTGLSLGSILLLVALGLAITYGLMGVINMAHGELMMLGAYATYMVQLAFQQWIPAQWFDFYLLVAIPVAFLTSALVGATLERSILQHLYGRPLETLLATWGISLVLMQLVRSLFGAQNVGVENPSWMSGSIHILPSLALPWNRVLIIGFALLVLLAVAAVISKTRLGLFVRGVTQNRPMASCMGVNTQRIDTYAFSLGCGIAGLAGCALSQIGNVGPDLGQGYIVDSFMVVVLGGVGQLAGTVYAALGLGLVNKGLEGWTGAVLAKIFVLIFIIIFIQKRPQGIFAMKGRSAEA